MKFSITSRALSKIRDEGRLVFKLTDQDMKTQRGTCQWHLGEWNPNGIRDGASGLCGPSFYHAYPFLDGYGETLALWRNPADAAISKPRLFLAEVQGQIEHSDDFCKLGATEQRLLKELPFVALNIEDYVVLSILASGELLSDLNEDWALWAVRWLNNEDRSESAARSAAESAAWSAESAAWSAEDKRLAAHEVLRNAIVSWKAGVGR